MSSSPGRPPLPKAERRSKRIFVCVTAAEHRTIRAARKRGQTLSDFGREALLAACQVRAEAPPSPPAVASPPPVPADGGGHIADPPPTAHGGGPAHGGPRGMGPSAQHLASPHQAQGRPHVADPPPPPHTAPSQQQPAPAVTAEEVKRRLTQAGVEGWQAFTAADKDPQRVADILHRAGGLSPGAIFNRIVRPGA